MGDKKMAWGFISDFNRYLLEMIFLGATRVHNPSQYEYLVFG